MAQVKTPENLFHDTLEVVYYAERHILKDLPKMATAAESKKLKAAFEKYKNETEKQIERLQATFEHIGKKAQGKKCEAIEGILKEGESIRANFASSEALDA